ncbi:hypothetical protein J6590_011674 [Homalodisca vitripennis]|nr:hypothetical protein J6590_011674 [Homalodisca vitripennis]
MNSPLSLSIYKWGRVPVPDIAGTVPSAKVTSRADISHNVVCFAVLSSPLAVRHVTGHFVLPSKWQCCTRSSRLLGFHVFTAGKRCCAEKTAVKNSISDVYQNASRFI